MVEITIAEDMIGGVGWSFGKFFKGVAKVATSVVKSPILKVGVGVLAVAFPVVGIPAAAAVAGANLALDKVASGAAAAAVVNANLAKLKVSAKAGNPAAATAVNAMQVALATRKAKAAGLPAPRPVAIQGKGSFSTTPRPVALPKTSLYQPTKTPAALALSLAAGGSPLGKTVLTAVSAGKAVEVPSGVVVVPGKAPMKGRRVWVGKVPAGIKATRVAGAHVVTKAGFVLTGQTVFASG
jgi:hypothetical protein